MKIIDIRESTRPIKSNIRNAYIDFSKMTLSLVAVVTDVVRDGKPVIGYGFNSNGRYGQGALMRERFIPRVLEADPASLLDDARRDNLDPHKVWATMMTNEKPGGHGERSVAVGTIDMAVWDAVAKIDGMPLLPAAGRSLRQRRTPTARSSSMPPAATTGRARGSRAWSARCAATSTAATRWSRRRSAALRWPRTASASRPCCSLLGPGQKLAVDANGRFDLPTAIAYAKALSAYDLFWYEEAGDPLDYALQAELAQHYAKPMATGENLFSMQDARNLIRYGGMRPDRDWLQFDCALSYGLVEYLRTLDMLKENGWSPSALHPARRPPDVAGDRRRPRARAATRATPTSSSPTAASPTA